MRPGLSFSLIPLTNVEPPPSPGEFGPAPSVRQNVSPAGSAVGEWRPRIGEDVMFAAHGEERVHAARLMWIARALRETPD
jgi:hypothetical protein